MIQKAPTYCRKVLMSSGNQVTYSLYDSQQQKNPTKRLRTDKNFQYSGNYCSSINKIVFLDIQGVGYLTLTPVNMPVVDTLKSR